MLSTFQRTSRVIRAAKSTGSLGKEVWVNLTGGNNVINLALQLSVALSGQPARFYYVQAENQIAEKCIYYTRENGYWVDIPLVPVAPNEANRQLIEAIQRQSVIEISALYSKAKKDLWQFFRDVNTTEQFERSVITPLVQQNLIEREGNRLCAGRLWPVLQPYYDEITRIDDIRLNLGQLATNENSWFHEEEIDLT